MACLHQRTVRRCAHDSSRAFTTQPVVECLCSGHAATWMLRWANNTLFATMLRWTNTPYLPPCCGGLTTPYLLWWASNTLCCGGLPTPHLPPVFLKSSSPTAYLLACLPACPPACLFASLLVCCCCCVSGAGLTKSIADMHDRTASIWDEVVRGV